MCYKPPYVEKAKSKFQYRFNINKSKHTILDKISQTTSRNKVKWVFLWIVLQLFFSNFLALLLMFVFWMTLGWVVILNRKRFRDFLEIFYFPKNLNLNCLMVTRELMMDVLIFLSNARHISTWKKRKRFGQSELKMWD